MLAELTIGPLAWDVEDMPSDTGRGKRECPGLGTSSQFARNWILKKLGDVPTIIIPGMTLAG